MNRLLTITITALFLAQTLAVVQAQDESNEQTIVDVASGTENHDTLVAALSHVGLDVTLNSEGPFTVFAPTDQAFTDAGVNLDDYDTDAENETLKDILLYHVISGAAVDSANVTDGMTAEAANTDTLTFTVTDGTVMIGEATVTSADVEASNGIIHVIDKILMPPADEPVDEPADETPASVCDVTIGIGDSGLAYDKVTVNIDVGETV